MNTGRVLSEHHKKYIEDLNSQCTIQIIGTKLSDHGIWKCLAHDDPFKGLQHTETSISVSKKFRTYSSISILKPESVLKYFKNHTVVYINFR